MSRQMMVCDGLIVKYMDLYHIHLAVTFAKIPLDGIWQSKNIEQVDTMCLLSEPKKN